MVDWDKFFEGLFKGLSAHGFDPVPAIALLVAALLVGLALWCVLAAIKRMPSPTSASSGDTRIVIEVRSNQDMQSKRLRQVLQQPAEEPLRGVLRHQYRVRGEQDLPTPRRSKRWTRRRA